jgi:hypothetical protein
VAQADQYTAVDLYALTPPAGVSQPFFNTYGQFAFGGQVVGITGGDPDNGTFGSAMFWNSDGSAEVLGAGYYGVMLAGTDAAPALAYPAQHRRLADSNHWHVQRLRSLLMRSSNRSNFAMTLDNDDSRPPW